MRLRRERFFALIFALRRELALRLVLRGALDSIKNMTNLCEMRERTLSRAFGADQALGDFLGFSETPAPAAREMCSERRATGDGQRAAGERACGAKQEI